MPCVVRSIAVAAHLTRRPHSFPLRVSCNVYLCSLRLSLGDSVACVINSSSRRLQLLLNDTRKLTFPSLGHLSPIDGGRDVV